MIKRFYQNYRSLRIWVVFFALSIAFLAGYALFLIRDSGEKQVEGLKNILKNEALSHFESLVVLRRWNAGHGGVFVRQHGDLRPNPYLKDNAFRSESGVTYLRVNPAWMTKQIAQIANTTTHHHYRITSLNPLNPENAPADAFEQRALQYLYDHPDQKYRYEFDLEKDRKIHLMGTLKTEPSCIECHGNYRVGEIRGGIRISLPAGEIAAEIGAIRKQQSASVLIWGSIVALVGIALFFIFRLIATSKEKDEMMMQQARHVAMADLLVSISHHWRQPLNALALTIQDLGEAREFGELDDRYIDGMIDRSMKQINYMSRVIDDFKSIVRQDPTPRDVLLSEIVQSGLYFNRPALLQNNITVSFGCRCKEKTMEASLKHEAACGDCNMKLYSYPGVIKQVLVNLIRNSIDAVTKHVEKGERRIAVEFSVDETYATIVVRDNGGGISKAFQKRIFDPYFTTKDTKESMGMGLYTSKAVVEQNLKGRIDVENQDGGAVFTVTFPRRVDQN